MRDLGIRGGYLDYRKRWRRPKKKTVEALTRILDSEEGRESPVRTMVIRRGEQPPIREPVELVTEDGGTSRLHDTLPPDVPLGYHDLIRLEDGSRTTLIVSPGACHLPPGLKSWGWAVQLYALRSEASWGIGDLSDLARFNAWSAARGAGATLVNPLHAVNPGKPQQTSPYSPGSRCWRNPIYVAVEQIPGADRGGVDLDPLRVASRALMEDRRIDRDAVYELKMKALEKLWPVNRDSPEWKRFATWGGDALEGFATFNALYEHHGGPPSRWPQEHLHPHNPSVAEWRRRHVDRVHFHQWVQWLLDDQVAGATGSGLLIQDLAIGVTDDGADAWLWQDVFATGASVGAPPDRFNSRGQDWGVLAFSPSGLQTSSYRPFIQTVRAAFRHAGGIRFDHVMGLWRLYLIPAGMSATEGAYVGYPAGHLLDIIALESHRASAVAIGEDLGTVERRVSRELAARNMLSYRVLWFEDKPPRTYPRGSLATVTNHDLPTVGGLWTGEDLRARVEMGLEEDDEASQTVLQRVRAWLALESDAPLELVVKAIYQLLSEAPSALVTATLEDPLGIVERVNHPGTTTEHPNWCLSLPLTLPELEDHELVREVGLILDRRSRVVTRAEGAGNHHPRP